MVLNLDTVILVIFLVVNLAVGLSSGRNIGNIKQYALGDRNFKASTRVCHRVCVSYEKVVEKNLHLTTTYTR